MSDKLCPVCQGVGEIRIADYDEGRVIYDKKIECPACQGSGVRHEGNRPAVAELVHDLKRPLATIILRAELTLRALKEMKDENRVLEEPSQQMEKHLKYILQQTLETGQQIDQIFRVGGDAGNPSQPRTDQKEISG